MYKLNFDTSVELWNVSTYRQTGSSLMAILAALHCKLLPMFFGWFVLEHYLMQSLVCKRAGKVHHTKLNPDGINTQQDLSRRGSS